MEAALEAFQHFASVVLEPLQRVDRRRVDDGAVADHADLGAAAQEAVRDHATGDRAGLRRLEGVAYLGLADRLLRLDGGEHSDQSLLDVLRQLVDDVVRADLDAFALGERTRLRVRADVEADDHPARRRREHDVVVGDAADTLVDDVDAHLGMLDLPELADDRLDGALHVALDHEVQVPHLAGLHLLEEVLERDARRALLGELLAAEALGALLRSLARLPLVLDDARELAGGRRLVEAEDLHRVARLGLRKLLALVVVQCAYLAPGVAGDDRVADLERAALDEHRRDGAAADVEPRLDDRTGRLRVRIRAQVELSVRDEQDPL